MTFLRIILALLVCCGSARAVFYYASPDGLDGNTGLSTSSPWPLQHALSNSVAGDTVVLLDGLYTSTSAYTVSSRVTVQAANKWKAVLTGSTEPSGFTVQNRLWVQRMRGGRTLHHQRPE